MRVLLFISVLFFVMPAAISQVADPPGSLLEQQLENSTENNNDNATEDDADLQQLQQFLQYPLDLNRAAAADLAALRVLSILQINQFIAYRELLGPLVSIYELQAVPLWDAALIRKIRPYITVSEQQKVKDQLMDRFIPGQHSVLVRVSQEPERSKGYLVDKNAGVNFYPGTPQKIVLRYTYVYKQLLQYGILAEKDPGEQFFKGQQKQGFDFYSFHLFVRQLGVISALAIGDFTVNLGQGLIQWQNLAFKKSADVMNIVRQSPVLRPYHSAGEINFHRGLGITLAKKRWEASVFLSYKKIDANLVTDSLQAAPDHVSSLQTSGYHRTAGEAADKGVLKQFCVGGNLSYRYRRWRLGINGISYRFSRPLQKSDEPYNRLSMSGSALTDFSLDYSYTYRNWHFFGELAANDHFAKALVSGLLVSVSASVDISACYRNIASAYQALYASAFTEAASPSNERGIYLGITVRPNSFWQIDAYADLYQFPWLKYRVDKPSAGSDFLVQATYKPSRQLEIYSRYRVETKALNNNPDALVLSPVTPSSRQDWRLQVNYRVSPSVSLRSRTEILWFDKRGTDPEEGFLLNFDLLYKPVLKRYSGNLRGQYFETGGYNSRLYAYENDVLYSFSIPVFYDKGYRYYVNLNYDVNKRLSLWARWAQTRYIGKNLIGTGLDEIKGSTKSEASLQVLYKF